MFHIRDRQVHARDRRIDAGDRRKQKNNKRPSAQFRLLWIATMTLELRKGNPCRILSKKYKECNAWYDKGRNNTKCKMAVIIEYAQGRLKSSLINDENVEEVYGEPASYEEAAMQQHPDIDLKFDSLCTLLAQCNIQSGESIKAIFETKLNRANIIQQSKGNKAVWRCVDHF